MKSVLRLTVVLPWLYLSVCVAQGPAPQSAAQAPFAGATISDFKGKASIQLPGQGMMAVSRGAILPAGTTVKTDDGRLMLHLADGSDVLVRPHTELLLKDPEASAWRYFQVLVGKVRTEVQKRFGTGPGFQIGTPSAVISVRGTKFDVEVDRRGFTEVDVDEGVVELDSLSGRGGPVMITAGFSSRVGMDSAPEVPRPTRDLRPQLDRPSKRDDKGPGDDDPIKKLEASDRDHHDHDQSGHGGGGGDSTASSGGGHDSGHDGDTSSGSGSGSGGRTGTEDGDHHSGSSEGDGDRHGGKPPAFDWL